MSGAGRLGRAAALAVWAGCCGPAWAQQTTVRVGDHPGFGRVVFDMPENADYDIVTAGPRVLIVFRGAGSIAPPGVLPRNVQAIEGGMDTATLRLANGASARPARMGQRLVIDVWDGRRAARPGPAGRPTGNQIPAASAPAGPALSTAPAPPPAADVAAPSPAAPKAEPVGAPAAAPMPPEPIEPTPPVQAGTPLVPVAQSPLPAPGPTLAPLLLRVDADVGAAAFRRGELALIVLDRRVPRPAGGLPAGVEWTAGPASTTVQLALPAGTALRMGRVPAGWSVEPAADAPQPGAVPTISHDALAVAVARPGRSVTIADPLTGGALLIGTSLAAGEDAGVQAGRRTPDYALLPTWLGIAVEPLADKVDLRAAGGAFVVAGTPPVPVGPQAVMSRRFDFPDQPPAALLNRLNAHLVGAAAAPVRARTRDRMQAARGMLTLGMGAEAQAVLSLVASGDPQAAADAELSGLAGIAAVLAGRPGEAAGLDDARLDGTDEVTLWRGLRDRAAGQTTAAVARLPEMMPLAWSYPPTLRRLVWPEVAEAAAEGGVFVAAERQTPLSAAIALDRAGKVDEAVAAYDKAVAGPDRWTQVRAAAALAELKLAAGRIKPGEAAAALERQAVAWRGDGREVAFRIRAAQLLGMAGEWRAALDALRAVDAQHPDQRREIQAGKARVLEAMLAAGGQGLSALQLVLLAAEHADAVPEGAAGAGLARLLADKLAALDLPARAIPVLQGLVRATPAGPARGEFGLRLARLLLDGGDAAAAQDALAASLAEGLSPATTEARALLGARAQASAGDRVGAMSALRALGSDAADDLRAELAAQAGDWRASLEALADLASRRVPAEGALSPAAQDVLMRQATAATQAGEAASLRQLERYSGRMTGPRADVFRMLTAAPLGAAADLPRAARELSLARLLPARLSEAHSR